MLSSFANLKRTKLSKHDLADLRDKFLEHISHLRVLGFGLSSCGHKDDLFH